LKLLHEHKKNVDVVMVNRRGTIFTFSEGWNEPLVTVCTSDNLTRYAEFPTFFKVGMDSGAAMARLAP
jgi:hypothetical protein